MLRRRPELAMLKHPTEVAGVEEPAGTRKCKALIRHQAGLPGTVCGVLWELAGEPFAPTRPAAGNNLSAVFGRHAGAKTVGTLALQNAGLKCTLHGGMPVQVDIGGAEYTSGVGF